MKFQLTHKLTKKNFFVLDTVQLFSIGCVKGKYRFLLKWLEIIIIISFIKIFLL